MLNYFAVLLPQGVKSTRSTNSSISPSYQASGRPIRKPDFFVRIWNLESGILCYQYFSGMYADTRNNNKKH